jgi:hypothetical protein
MKRQTLLRHLRRHGCDLVREGRSHTIWEILSQGIANLSHDILRLKTNSPDVFAASLVFRNCQISTIRPYQLAQQAGEVLGLDIYGGDCLVTPDGALCLIDINDWPSLRGCRPVTATCIAQHILTQAQQRGRL